MYVFICPNEACPDHGLERLFDYDRYRSDSAENDAQPAGVACGVCGTFVTRSARQVPDDYHPPRPGDDGSTTTDQPDAVAT